MNNTVRKLLALLMVLVLAAVTLMACVDDAGVPEDSDTTEPSTSTPGSDEPQPTDIVEIASEAELLDAAAKIAADTDGYASKYFRLTADIALTADFAPITGFTGTFDGQFHTISGLNIDSNLAGVGLFSTLNGATVMNLNLVATGIANSAPEASVGILAGSAENATVSCVTVSGSISVAGNRAVAGGVIGTVTNSTLLNVKSTAALSGAGELAGGIVGRLNDKGMLINAYSGAEVTATASTTAAAVARKAADSAVAFVLVSEGDVVAEEESVAWMPSYIIACQVGGSAADMGWNEADWDVSGEEPAIKTELEKPNAAPAVTVDGTAATVKYGEALPTSLQPAADENSTAFAGYLLGEDAYYAALPVVNDMALTSDTVDYGVLAGEWVAMSKDGGTLTVAQAVTFGTTDLTRVWATEEEGLPVLYFADAEGAIYRLAIQALNDNEKTTYGFTAEGAALLALGPVDGTAALYMPVPGSFRGAWAVGENTVIYTDTVEAGETLNSFASFTVGLNRGTYRTCLQVTDGAVAVVADGWTLGEDNGTPVLVKGSEKAAVAADYYEGSWYDDADNELVIAGGKVGDTALTVMSTPSGTGLWNPDTETLYVATIGGMVAVTDEGEAAYANGDFSGDWILFDDGKELVLRIIGDKVYINGSDEAVDGTISVDANTGMVTFTYQVGDESFVYVRDGVVLKSTNGKSDYYSGDAVKALYGDFILGSVSFSLDDAMLITYVNGEKTNTQNLTILYENNELKLAAGELVFSLSGSRVMLSGYSSIRGEEITSLQLFTVSELSMLYAAFNGEWMASSSAGIKYDRLSMSFANHIMTVDGAVVAYEITEANGVYTVYVSCVYEGSAALIAMRPDSNLIRTSGASLGTLMPKGLLNAVGGYYEFLVGTGEEGEPAPDQIRFNPFGELTVGGVTYGIGQYLFETTGQSYILKVVAPGAPENLSVTFNGDKTLSYNGKTYYNYDSVIPSDTYNQIGMPGGSASLEVVVGSTGRYETDEEEGEVWVPAVYPLFGFRYTDADGKIYTSGNSYSWSCEDGMATIMVPTAADDGSMLVLTITMPEGNDFSQLSLRAGNAEAITLFSGNSIESFVGNFKNQEHSFSIDEHGVMTVDGVSVAYTFEREGSVDRFTVDGKTYVIDRNVPEIAKCGDEIFYDARYAQLAGIELTAVRRYTTEAEEAYKMLLTEEGWFFNGEKIVWSAYEYNDDIMRFTVTELIEGVEVPVEWKLETSGGSLQNFGLCFYPNKSDPVVDWDQRWFVPSILFRADTYKGEADVLKVQQPDYTEGFVPFAFLINNLQYDYSDYTFAMVDGVFCVDLGDGNVLTFAEGDDELVVTLNGEALEPFTPPSLDEFEVEEQKIFGGTLTSQVVTIKDGQITYNPTSSWPTTVEVYAPGVWNGYDVIYFTASGTDYVVIKTEFGPFSVVRELLDLCGSYTLNGKSLAVGLTFSADGPAVSVTCSDAAVSEVGFGSQNLPYDSETYITFAVDGERYYLVPNVLDPDGGNIVAPEDIFHLCMRISLNHNYGYLLAYISKDAEGNVALTYILEADFGAVEQEVALAPVDGKPNVYSFSYEYEGETYTEYVGQVTGAASGYGMMTLDAELIPYIGSFTLADGKTLEIRIDAITESDGDVVIGLLANYNGTEAGEADWSSSMTLTFQYTENETEYTCYVILDGDTVSVTMLNAAQNAFIGNGFKLVGGGYYDEVDVAYGSDGFTVTFKDNPTTNVYFNEDNTRLYFTQDGVEYCLVMVDASQSTAYYRAAAVTAAQAAWIGRWELANGKVLQIAVSAGYSASISASYDGSTVSELIFHSAELLSFRIGDTYYGVMLQDGVVTVEENILDNEALEFLFLGTYEDRGIVFGYAVTVEDGKIVARYTVTKDGEVLSYSIDPQTLVITINNEDGSKTYYTRCTGSTVALAELTEAEVNMLGSYTIGENTVVLVPNFTASYNSRNETYSYTAGYKLTLNSNAPVDVKFSTDNAETPNQYIQFEADGKTYLFFVTEPGVSAVLHELTEDQLAMMGVSISIDVTGNYDYKYLKTSIVFAADGSFELGLTFDDAPISERTDNEYGYSFKDAEGTTWYVITTGSSPYMASATQFGWYMKDQTVGGHTITVAPGSSSSYPFVVTFDGSELDAYDVDFITGEYTGLQFEVNGVTYVLARDTTDGDKLVLNVLDESMASALSFSKYITITLSDGTKYSGTLKAVVAIDAEGNLSIGWDFGSNPAPSSVEFLAGKDGINADVMKVTIEGEVVYGLMHYTSTSQTSFYMAWATEAQYALMGTWEVNGTTLIIGLNAPNFMTYMMVTYDEKSVTSNKDMNLTEGSPCFKTVEMDGVSTVVCEFTIDGTTYHAYLVDGTMTVTEAAA